MRKHMKFIKKEMNPNEKKNKSVGGRIDIPVIDTYKVGQSS